VRGIADACRAFGVPITGGNVSLYNETDGRAIYPTPVLGVVGLIEDAAQVLRRSFRSEGDFVYLLGETGDDLGGSEMLKVVHGKVAGRPPRLDLAAEKGLHALLAEGAARGVLLSAHDLSDGGLAVAAAECCFAGEEPGLGARLDLPGPGRPDVLLFAETPSRALVTTRDELRIAELARCHGVRWTRVGTVGGDRLVIASGGATRIDLGVAELQHAWMSLERGLQQRG
jgi:phosphoribosylformylglycinamidine synthase